MHTTKLSVPFIYNALIIKPRCRNMVEVQVRDVIDVEIRHFAASELPLSFKVGKVELPWYDNQSWHIDHETVYQQEPRKVHFDEVIQNTANPELYEWSCSGAAAPFHNIWSKIETPWKKTHGALGSAWLKDKHVVTREETTHREWIKDNRQDVVELIQKAAKTRIVIDGILFRPIGEPRYSVMTYGLGGLSGSVDIHVDFSFNSNVSKQNYFRADKLHDAKKYAQEVADNGQWEKRYFDVLPIEVLLPEAVMLKVPHKD